MDKIGAVGAAIMREKVSGFFTVRTWVRAESSEASQTQDYIHLSWTEAMDVILSTWDDNRPGWGIGVGQVQPDLWTQFG